MKSLTLLIIGILLAAGVAGQAPQGVKYQAVARNSTGDPLCNRAMFIKFSILEGTSSGTLIYQEIHAVQTNEYGLLNLNLGEGNTGGHFSNINWGNGQSKWIRVDMDTTGGSQFFTMGVTQLLSVPYAFYAETAGNSSGETLWQQNGNNIYYSSGNVGIGTNNPNSSSALEVSTTTAGFLPPRMTTSQRDMISNPATGLMIFNLTTNCLNLYKPGGWFELCGDCIPPPQPTAQSNSPACQGDTLKLYAINAGGASCQWTGPNGFSTTVENPIITPVQALHAGTYTLSTSNICGSTTPVSVTVSIAPLPGNAGSITGTNEFCANTGPYTYSTTAVEFATEYQWTVPLGAEITGGQGTQTIQVMFGNNAISGNISVTPKNSCGNGTVSSPYAITVNAQPDESIAGSDQLNLSGNTATLQANSPVNGVGEWLIASGSGGSFSSALNPSTQFTGSAGVVYQLVWKISNSCGISADTMAVSFTSSSFTCGGSLLDIRDGQTYPTVQIGSQCWMAKNLNYGTMIEGTVTAADNSIVEKYCYQNLLTYCDSHGALYSWREMLQLPSNCENISCAGLVGTHPQGICPDGWHIPSDQEFKVLEIALGMSAADADLLNTWRGHPVGTMLLAGGSSGFEALLGGRKAGGNAFALLGNDEYTYTCDEQAPDYAFRRCLELNVSTVGRWNTFPKSWALSVRCVKN